MANRPAASSGSEPSSFEGAGATVAGSAAFQRELERARRHLARLEAEAEASARPKHLDHSARFDESPAFARVCNLMIWAIVLLPVVLAVVTLTRRLAG